MQMKNHLPGICACVDDQAVAAGGDALLFGDLLRDEEQVSQNGFIVRGDVVHGLDVFVWHNQDVRRRDGMEVAEGGRLLIAENDFRFGSAVNNFAEDAVHGRLVFGWMVVKCVVRSSVVT